METRSDRGRQKVRLSLLRASEMTSVVWQYIVLFGGVDQIHRRHLYVAANIRLLKTEELPKTSFVLFPLLKY